MQLGQRWRHCCQPAEEEMRGGGGQRGGGGGGGGRAKSEGVQRRDRRDRQPSGGAADAARRRGGGEQSPQQHEARHIYEGPRGFRRGDAARGKRGRPPTAAMPNRLVNAAHDHHARQLHLERLASIEGRRRRPSSSAGALAAGSGPERPWAQPPPRKPAYLKPPPMTKVLGAKPAKLSYEQQEHARHVAALFGRLQKIELGVEHRRREHAEHAQAAGRARITSAPARRRTQHELKQSNDVYLHRLRTTSARFASPAEIALLTGKQLPGAATGGGAGADDEGEDDE